jgi:Major Facilitator Superfamily.
LIITAIGILERNLYVTTAGISLGGFASAFYHPMGGSALTYVYGIQAGSAMGINGAFSNLGTALYPSIMFGLLSFLSITNLGVFYSLIILSIASLIASIPLMLIKFRTPNKNYVRDRNNQFVISFPLIILTIIMLLRAIFTQGVIQFLPTMLITEYSYKFNIDLGYTLTIIFAAGTLGQPTLGYLSDKFGRVILLTLSTIFSIFFFFIFIYTALPYFLIIFGLFALSNFSLALSLAGEIAKKEGTGLANAYVWGLGNTTGSAIGPALVGLLSQYFSISFFLQILSLFAILSIFLVFAISKKEEEIKVQALH